MAEKEVTERFNQLLKALDSLPPPKIQNYTFTNGIVHQIEERFQILESLFLELCPFLSNDQRQKHIENQLQCAMQVGIFAHKYHKTNCTPLILISNCDVWEKELRAQIQTTLGTS